MFFSQGQSVEPDVSFISNPANNQASSVSIRQMHAWTGMAEQQMILIKDISTLIDSAPLFLRTSLAQINLSCRHLKSASSQSLIFLSQSMVIYGPDKNYSVRPQQRKTNSSN